MNFFERIDMFGPEMKIKIKGSEKYKSNIGGIFTILYFSVVILGFIAFGRDLYERNIPYVTFNRKLNPEALFILNSENFAFTVYNQVDNSDIENFEKKFHFYMHRFDNYRGGYKEEKFFFEKCDTNVMNMKSNLIKSSDKYYCLQKGKVIEIKGVVNFTPNSTTARLNIDFCVNGVDNRTDCIPKNDTIKSMKNINMHIIIDDCYADSLNYTEPLRKSHFTSQVLTNAFSFARQIHYFKNIEFITDEGLLLESFNKMEKVSIDSIQNTNVPSSSNTIYSHMFQNSIWKDSYKRSYIKLQGVFAYIGGFLSLSHILFNLLCNILIVPDIIHIFTNKYLGKSQDEINLNKSESNFLNNLKSIYKNNNKLKKREENNDTYKYKEFKKFNVFQNLCRFLPFKTRRIKEKIKDLKFYDNLLRKKFSIEHMTGIFRKIKLFENILFERQTIEIMKYCNLQKNNKNYTLEDLYSQINMKLYNGIDFERRISKNIINHL